MRPEQPSTDDDVVALTVMLGSQDPSEREQHALPLLLSWVTSGALDPRLEAVGDGMASGLLAGLGGTDRAAALRRAGSLEVLAAVLRRSTELDSLDAAAAPRPGDDAVLHWADSLFTWLLRERHHAPLASPGAGADTGAVGHGAGALEALAHSPRLDAVGRTVLLDVVADRVLAPGGTLGPISPGDVDRLARACLAATQRGLPGPVVAGWVRRLAHDGPDTPRHAVDLLRTMQLRLALGAERPDGRADLLIDLGAAVRASAPHLFEA